MEKVVIDTDDGTDARVNKVSPPEAEITNTILKEFGKDYNELLVFL